MKMQRGILTVAFAAALPVLCGGATFTVEIRNFYFTPTNLVIQLGDTVTWRNTSFTPHDTTQNAPAGSRLWSSPTLAQNETFSHTFTQAGVFPYMCALHVGIFPQQTGTVAVVAANIPPTVQITAPASGASFAAPASFSVEANANDSDGAVNAVQFFANGSLLGTSTGPSFAVAVTSLPAGNYTLTAVATDDKGATGTSAPINVSVQELASHALTVTQSPLNGGTVSIIPPQPPQGYSAGTAVTLTAVPATGFAFSGWSGDAAGSDNPMTVTMESPRNIVANFSPIVTPTFPLTIAVEPEGSGSIGVNPAPNASDGMYVQGTIVSLTAISAPGFAFTNWNGDASGTSNVTTIVMDGPRAVSANFFAVVLPIFTLEVQAAPVAGGAIQVNPPPNATGGRYFEGTMVTLTALPSSGYTFSNWSGVFGTSNVVSFILTGDRSVTAHFDTAEAKVHQLTLRVTPPEAGSIAVTPPGSNGLYAAGTHLALAAQPAAGFRFVRWTGAVNTTNNPIPLVFEQDAAVTAEFERVPGLVFASLRGAYTGLLTDDTRTNYTASGAVMMRVSSTGAFRGIAWIGGIRTPLRGQFDRFGYAPLIARGATLIGSMQLVAEAGRIHGLLADSPLTTTTTLRLASETKPSETEFTGSYNITLPPSDPVSGTGILVMEVRSDGVVRIKGRLGDGTRVARRTFVTADGEIPFFVPLYQRRGAILGWINLPEEGSSMSWFRPGDSRNVEYPAGFSLLVIANTVRN